MSLQIIAIVLVIAYGAVDKGIAAPTHYTCNGPKNVYELTNQTETKLFCLTRDTMVKKDGRDTMIKLQLAKEKSKYLGINREGEVIEDASTSTTLRRKHGSLCATLNDKEGKDSLNGAQITYVISPTGKGFRVPKACCMHKVESDCCTTFHEKMKEPKYQWLLKPKY